MVSKPRKAKVCAATNVTRVNNSVDAALRQGKHEETHHVLVSTFLVLLALTLPYLTNATDLGHTLCLPSSPLRVLHRIFLQKTREEIARSKAAAAASKSRGSSLKVKGDKVRAKKKVTGMDVVEGAEVVWMKVQESKREGRRARLNEGG